MDDESCTALDKSIELVTMPDLLLDEEKYKFQPVTHDGSIKEVGVRTRARVCGFMFLRTQP